MNRSSVFLSGAVLGLAALFAVGTGYAQAADYKIGFVNTERLFREAAPAKRAQLKLEKEFAARDSDIQKLSKQVRDLQGSLEKDGVFFEFDRPTSERDNGAANGREAQA